MFEFYPNTAFIAGQEETTDLASVKILIKEKEVFVGDAIMNIVSTPAKRTISPTEEEWKIIAILRTPQYFQALPKKITILIRRRNDEVIFMRFNDQVFTSKAYYSNALPMQTSVDTSTYHKVLYGENLGRIGRKYHKTLEELYTLNPGMNKNIVPGQKIKIK